MKITIEGNRALAPLRLDAKTAMMMPRLEGQRRWLRSGQFSFEATHHNIEVMREVYPYCEIEDLNGELQAFDISDNRKVCSYSMKTKPFAHQQKAFDLCKDSPFFALFMDQGTGKTKVAIDKAGHLYSSGKIDAVLVVSLNGVHRQWAEGQIPQHLSVKHEAYAWCKKGIPKSLFQDDSLKFFCTYIDAIGNQKGYDSAHEFIKAHSGRVLLVIDESHSIKNYKARRTEAAMQLGGLCSNRMILTGTPISRNVVDIWSQFKFLHPSIIGMKYITAFRQEYCIMGGFNGREVVGQKNVERLQQRVAPYSFRVTKEEALDLPEKIYNEWVFSMHPEQKKKYDELKDNFTLMLDSGEISSVANAANLMIRLQQISCGVVVDDDGLHHEVPDARFDELQLLLDSLEGKIVIWARFNSDIVKMAKLLGDRCVTYYGDTKQSEREQAVAKFLDAGSGIDYFVSNPAAGGTGLNLQGDCTTAIYYSNSFSAIQRWQSEDRIHRIGTTGSVQYYDMVCRGSVDRRILQNLRQKKSISDLALTDIRKMLEDL